MKSLIIALMLLCGTFCSYAQSVEVLYPFNYQTDFQDIFVAEAGKGLAIGNCGWMATTENGTDWSMAAAPDAGDNAFSMVACKPGTNCEEVWLGAGDQLFWSTDGGQAWSDAIIEGLSTPREMHFLSADVFVVSHAGQSFLRTTDGGASWEEVPLSGSYRNAAVFVAPDLGFVPNQTTYNLLRTIDMGATWDSLYHFEERPLFLDMVNATTGFIYLQDRTVHKTIDGGSSWNLVSDGAISANARHLIAFDETNLWLSSFPSSYLVSSDGGQNWTSAQSIEEDAYGLRTNNIHRSGDQMWIASNTASILYSADRYETKANAFPADRETIESIQFADEQTGFALCERKGLFKTIDGGNSWDRILTDFGVVSRDMLVRSATDLIIPYNYSGPQRSSDGGLTWAPLLPAEMQDTIFVFQIEELPGGRLYLKGSTQAVYSDDNGESWTVLYHGLGGFQDMLYFYDDQLGFSGGQGGRLARTEDGGNSWTSILEGELTNQPIRNIYMRDELHGMINIGVTTYCTADGGLTWSTSDCMGYDPPGMVTEALNGDLYSSYRNGEKRVISRSQDQGQTWEDIQEFCTRNIEMHSIAPGNGYLYMGWSGSLIARFDLESIVAAEEPQAPSTGLRVAPNPTSGKIQVFLPDGVVTSSEAQLRLFNSKGQLCRQRSLQGAMGTVELDITDLPSGLYVLDISGMGVRFQGKLLKL